MSQDNFRQNLAAERRWWCSAEQNLGNVMLSFIGRKAVLKMAKTLSDLYVE
jgi:hypothetical protein